MNTEIELSNFFTSIELPPSSELTYADKLIQEVIEKDFCGDTETFICAQIDYDYLNPCGYAASGKHAYVINRLKSKAVSVTVETKWRRGGAQGSHEVVRVLPPGGKYYLGCTVSSSSPITDYSFRVVNCRAL